VRKRIDSDTDMGDWDLEGEKRRDGWMNEGVDVINYG